MSDRSAMLRELNEIEEFLQLVRRTRSASIQFDTLWQSDDFSRFRRKHREATEAAEQLRRQIQSLRPD